MALRGLTKSGRLRSTRTYFRGSTKTFISPHMRGGNISFKGGIHLTKTKKIASYSRRTGSWL